jgi:hypothetical protein
VGQPLEGRLLERATVVLAPAGGHSGDQACSLGLGDGRGCCNVAGQPTAAAAD